MTTPLKNLETSELRRLAIQYVAGNVYTSNNVPENLLYSVFMPLVFMDDTQRDLLKEAGLIYAVVGQDTTSGWGVNGYPTFFSFKFLSKEDTLAFGRYVIEASDFGKPTAREQERKRHDDEEANQNHP